MAGMPKNQAHAACPISWTSDARNQPIHAVNGIHRNATLAAAPTPQCNQGRHGAWDSASRSRGRPSIDGVLVDATTFRVAADDDGVRGVVDGRSAGLDVAGAVLKGDDGSPSRRRP